MAFQTLREPDSAPWHIWCSPLLCSSFRSSSERRAVRLVVAWMLHLKLAPARTNPSEMARARSRSTRKLSSTIHSISRPYLRLRSTVSSTNCSAGRAFHLRPYTPALVQYAQLKGHARLDVYIAHRLPHNRS